MFYTLQYCDLWDHVNVNIIYWSNMIVKAYNFKLKYFSKIIKIMSQSNLKHCWYHANVNYLQILTFRCSGRLKFMGTASSRSWAIVSVRFMSSGRKCSLQTLAAWDGHTTRLQFFTHCAYKRGFFSLFGNLKSLKYNIMSLQSLNSQTQSIYSYLLIS